MLYLCYLCQFKPLRDHLRGFLIAAWAGDKIAEFSFPEISFYFPLRPWFFFVSPAYAGKSATSRPAAISRLGSPPRMRGKGIVLVCVGHVHGITPAYAGKSYRLLKVFVSKPGSPPRMRGKDFWHYADNYATGITPAYAGKSAQLEGASPLAQDHPRVCGEKRDFSRLPPFLQGSPPRMRGKGVCA